MSIDDTMTLLDRFAIAALPEVIAAFHDDDDGTAVIAIAGYTYKIAGAMLHQHNAIAEQVRAQAKHPASPTT